MFRALVYNKGGAVLHMLRRLLGDDVFFAGVRRFYREYKFRKAGTEDLRRALEAESGRSLEIVFRTMDLRPGRADGDGHMADDPATDGRPHRPAAGR